MNSSADMQFLSFKNLSKYISQIFTSHWDLQMWSHIPFQCGFETEAKVTWAEWLQKWRNWKWNQSKSTQCQKNIEMNYHHYCCLWKSCDLTSKFLFFEVASLFLALLLSHHWIPLYQEWHLFIILLQVLY